MIKLIATAAISLALGGAAGTFATVHVIATCAAGPAGQALLSVAPVTPFVLGNNPKY